MNRQIKIFIIVLVLLGGGGVFKMVSVDSISNTDLTDAKLIETPEKVKPNQAQDPISKVLPTSNSLKLDTEESDESVEVVQAPALPDYYIGLESVEDSAARFATLDEPTISAKIVAITKTLTTEKWIERANQGALSLEQRQRLAFLLHRESALRLSRILRQLNQVEEDVL